MSPELECFWWSADARRANYQYKFHIVQKTVPETSPNGTGGTRHYFYCGKTIETWQVGGDWPIERRFGTAKEALKRGLEVCEGCFIGLPKEMIRRLRQTENNTTRLSQQPQ